MKIIYSGECWFGRGVAEEWANCKAFQPPALPCSCTMHIFHSPPQQKIPLPALTVRVWFCKNISSMPRLREQITCMCETKKLDNSPAVAYSESAVDLGLFQSTTCIAINFILKLTPSPPPLHEPPPVPSIWYTLSLRVKPPDLQQIISCLHTMRKN